MVILQVALYADRIFSSINLQKQGLLLNYFSLQTTFEEVKYHPGIQEGTRLPRLPQTRI